MPNYHAKVLEKVPTKPGCWEYTRVGVFDGDTQVGEYQRNYPSHAETTFCPFEQDGRWFALYSRHYTATRVMSLPDCTDLGGEEPAGNGFCPVEYLVPELTARVLDPLDPQPKPDSPWAKKLSVSVEKEHEGVKYIRNYSPVDREHPSPPSAEDLAEYKAEQDRNFALYKAWSDRRPFVTRHARWGFVHGCQWGGPYWTRFVDLSRAAEGVLAVDDRFGFLDLPGRVKLKDAVEVNDPDFHDGPPDDVLIHIARPVLFDLTGKKLGDE